MNTSSPYQWNTETRAELSRLWHASNGLAKKPGETLTSYDRKIWVAEQFSKEHPECSSTAAYKELDRSRIGQYTL